MKTRRPILTAEEIWRKYDGVEQRLTSHVSERVLDLARLGPGMREMELLKEAEPLQKNGYIRLGGVTRIVVASSAE